MSALTAARDTAAYQPNTPVRSYPVKGSTTIYAGSIVMLGSDGYAIPGAASTTATAAGRANETVVNSGSDGAVYVQVQEGIFHWANGSSLTLSAVGTVCYISDDQTVVATAGGARIIAGIVTQVDSTGIWVSIGLEAAIDDTALTAFESSLSSTAHSAGASLVGVEDSQSLLTAAQVEAALTEIVKKANAALGVPFSVAVWLSQIHTSGLPLCTYIAPTAGKLSKLECSVAVPATSAGGIATLTWNINSTPTTGGALAVITSTVTTLGHRVAASTITAANAFVATDVLTLEPSGVTLFGEGVVNVQTILASA